MSRRIRMKLQAYNRDINGDINSDSDSREIDDWLGDDLYEYMIDLFDHKRGHKIDDEINVAFLHTISKHCSKNIDFSLSSFVKLVENDLQNETSTSRLTLTSLNRALKTEIVYNTNLCLENIDYEHQFTIQSCRVQDVSTNVLENYAWNLDYFDNLYYFDDDENNDKNLSNNTYGEIKQTYIYDSIGYNYNYNPVNTSNHNTTDANINMTIASIDTGVDIYILDTGIVGSHSEFYSGQIINLNNGGSSSSVDNETNIIQTTDAYDDVINFHGTHVAGIVSGKKYGVAKHMVIYDLPICSDGNQCKFEDILYALETVYTRLKSNLENGNNRRGVINLSIAGGLTSAIKRFWDKILFKIRSVDGIIVAAAGNQATDACTVGPAFSQYVITVGSINRNLEPSSFTNYGYVLCFMFSDNINIGYQYFFNFSIFRLVSVFRIVNQKNQRQEKNLKTTVVVEFTIDKMTYTQTQSHITYHISQGMCICLGSRIKYVLSFWFWFFLIFVCFLAGEPNVLAFCYIVWIRYCFCLV